MRKLLLLALCVAATLSSYAQLPALAWANRAGSTDEDAGRAVTADAAGNVYVTGTFSGTVDFDPGPGVTSLSSQGGVFLTKSDAAGNLVWARVLEATGGNDGGAYPTGIAVDRSGNVVTTGVFVGTVDFDPGIGNYDVAADSPSAYISKLDASGNFSWAHIYAAERFSFGTAVSLDSADNIYAGGYFRGRVDFDPPNNSSMLDAGPNNYYGYVTRLSPSGSLVWFKEFTSLYCSLEALTTDRSGNVYSTGTFYGTADFDPGPAAYPIARFNYTSAFVCKLDNAGNFGWAQAFDGSSQAKGIALDRANGVFTTGSFDSQTDFDPSPSGTYSLSPADSSDAYISRLDSSGNFVAAGKVGGTGDDHGTGLAVNRSGNLFLTGTFTGTADLNPGAATQNFTSRGGTDVFMLRLGSTGAFVAAGTVGGTGNDDVPSMSLTSQGSLLLTGSFENTVDFDPGSGTRNLTSAGSLDAYTMKLGACQTTTSSLSAVACNHFAGPSGKVYTASGTYRDTTANQGGCDSIVTLTLNILRTDTTVLRRRDSLLSAEVGATYQWYECSGPMTAIPGATNRVYRLRNSGYYRLVVTKNGCRDTSACRYYVYSTTGIDDVAAPELSLFPNPAHSYVSLSCGSAAPLEGSLTLTDLSGKTLLHLPSVRIGRTYRLDLPGMAAGLYFLRFRDGQGRVTQLRFVRD